ncbi:family 92 glycoside hydrolase [Melampsora larici-populina 98AG31]|uniref:Family 92 glycoside hydrolase n=1 Tax=Melampsora larici-populina (strain 98AG31 / pathotype 3-4-7) TaxID=747676 RepID=F4S7D5_MELLP|nr:family 92 glycoside hydrolase [Melampsora larici-populina 98AG31]EGF99442.1 family 92 glycoside hydrolase [Melampsora larici-populina 98AG31]
MHHLYLAQNPFIWTNNLGDVSLGASSYLAHSTARIYGLSPLHNSGTRSSLGSYGNFQLLPTQCPHGFNTWVTKYKDRFGMNSKGIVQTTLDIPVTYVQGDYKLGALFSYPPGVNSITTQVGVLFVYSSMYCSFMTPNNATGETQEIAALGARKSHNSLNLVSAGVFANTTLPYFDSLYCSWDTTQTVYLWMNLHLPVENAQIAETCSDGSWKNGILPGWTQGGSDGTNILADFALKYSWQAASLGVDLQEMYTALVSDAEQTLAIQYKYIPYTVLDAFSTGRQTCEGSRNLEYAFRNFGISQVAQLLNHLKDAHKHENQSLWYQNIWDPTVTSDGFKGFFQKCFANRSYAYTDPKACSPEDTEKTSSIWEYSFYAPNNTAYLIKLHGGNETLVNRLDHFFEKGHYLAGNKPSFQTFVGYHYAGKPADSVSRVQSVVCDNFNTGPGGFLVMMIKL